MGGKGGIGGNWEVSWVSFVDRRWKGVSRRGNVKNRKKDWLGDGVCGRWVVTESEGVRERGKRFVMNGYESIAACRLISF